jgi:hypothetical protein
MLKGYFIPGIGGPFLTHPTDSGGDVVATGTYAARPSAGTAGAVYYPNDAWTGFVDDGSAWRPMIQGVVGVSPPAASGFTAANASATSALVDNNGALVASDDTLNNTPPNYRIWHKSLSGATVVEALWWPCPTMTDIDGNFQTLTYGGICLRESGTGKIAVFQTFLSPDGTRLKVNVSCEYATSATTGRTVIGSDTDKHINSWLASSQMYFRLRLSGGNVLYEMSVGRVWTAPVAVASVATTTAFTTAPDQYGIVAWTYNNNNPSSTRIVVPHLTTY